jgi:hypothetical protein
MLIKIREYRLSYSIVFSVLVHLLAFFSLVFLVQHFPPIRQENSTFSIQVKLTQPLPIISNASTDKRHKISAIPTPLKTLPIHAKETVDIKIKPDLSSETAVRGIAFPGAISNSFLGGTGSRNGFSAVARPTQPDAQIQFQQAMTEQARQRLTTQYQLITERFQQRLKQIFASHETVSGQCLVIETEGLNKTSANPKQFECSSPKIFEIIKAEQQNLIDLMIVLNGQKKSVQGFSIDKQTDKFDIILIQSP